MAAVETTRECSVPEEHGIRNVDLLNVEECKKNLVITSKGNFKWYREFGTLQLLFDRLLQKHTNWSKPGGSCRKLEINKLNIRWY